MIIGITILAIIMTLAFAWLMYETRFLTVRMESYGYQLAHRCEYGASCQWRMLDNAVTKDMRRELVNLSGNGHRLTWGEFKKWMSPLCGWGYAYQYRNFRPEYKVELIAPGSKYTFRTDSTSILRDVFRVYRNPYLKVKV